MITESQTKQKVKLLVKKYKRYSQEQAIHLAYMDGIIDQNKEDIKRLEKRLK